MGAFRLAEVPLAATAAPPAMTAAPLAKSVAVAAFGQTNAPPAVVPPPAEDVQLFQHQWTVLLQPCAGGR